MSTNIEQVYYRYGPMVLRRCRQLLGDAHLAEEAMQDVFVKVIKQQHTLDLTTPSSLLYRIATNVCLNLIRDGRAGSLNSNIEDQDILLEIANNEQLEKQTISDRLLEIFMGKHSESTRTIATLHYFDGMTLQEVADEVGMSVSGVRKRLRLFKQKVEKYKDEIKD